MFVAVLARRQLSLEVSRSHQRVKFGALAAGGASGRTSGAGLWVRAEYHLVVWVKEESFPFLLLNKLNELRMI